MRDGLPDLREAVSSGVAASNRKPIASAALRARWARLPRPSQAVLAAAVVHGQPLSDGWLAELAAAPTHVDPLVSGGWLREERTGDWSLDGSLPGETLREIVPWSQRRAAHLALGRLLERERDRWDDAAGHLAAVGLREEAGRRWLAAAREAVENAHVCGRTDLETQATILLGLNLGMRGEIDAGRRQLEAALGIALGAGLTAHAADAYRSLGTVEAYTLLLPGRAGCLPPGRISELSVAEF